jgi:hypothetical protein
MDKFYPTEKVSREQTQPVWRLPPTVSYNELAYNLIMKVSMFGGMLLGAYIGKCFYDTLFRERK